ncbi:MAG: hypothetical protein RLY78_4422 [Pseudomonadota bacterium]
MTPAESGPKTHGAPAGHGSPPVIDTAATATVRVHQHLDTIHAADWDALLARQARPTPFMAADFLRALVDSGSATPDSGWHARFITVEHEGRLLAAAPAWLKTHSWGEYVFDWAWADAYRRHGLRYYPKLVVAVPFMPVAGSRLLAVDAASRARLLEGLVALAQAERASSIHLLFHDDADDALGSAQAGWLRRDGVQFHWCQREDRPWPDFDAFLADLQHDKRKKIRQERRKVAEAGITFTVHQGAQIDEPLWDFFHHCYTLTYQAHGGHPYLQRAFWRQWARTAPGQALMFVARRDGQAIAASLLAIDTATGQAWGRHWGAVETVSCLHFEACYYQPLQWCIAHGFTRFEGGAQGEHKMARGLLPAPTRSAHWLAHPQFSAAVADFLQQEGRAMAGHVDELREHSPFRELAPPDDPPA